ncbi:hypothetical protein KY092_10550 [Natronomonas gomsonensis]|jgi:hypothetical protein|uniref:hypothetical protein n=1 Tax=Natronomonas gomsonensis TaxID=1046043 RepID=UPI0020CA293C|nr:hypothetical protein [Natronomonas gomsonensis]MCY4730993.1 hypothetical protein [Natronomonas gomsonensis]
MNQGTTQAGRTASAPPASERVTRTQRGDLVVTIPALAVRVLSVLAVLVAGIAVPAAVVGVLSVVGTPPLALLTLPALLAVGFVAPFAAVGVAATLLG